MPRFTNSRTWEKQESKKKKRGGNHSIKWQTVETMTKFPSKMAFSFNVGSFGKGEKYKYRNNLDEIELTVMVNKNVIYLLYMISA